MDNTLRDYCPFGWHQKRLTWLLAAASLATAPQAAMLVFIGETPPWHCRSAVQGTGSNADPPRLMPTTSASNTDVCGRYSGGDCSPVFIKKFATASAEFGLICDKDADISYVQSLYFLGMLLGSFLAGWCSDAYGRRYATVGGFLLCFGGSLWTTFASSFWTFAFSRCLAGIGSMLAGVSANVLLSESVAPEYRALTTTLPNLVFSWGLSSMSLIAYIFADNWRKLTFVLSLELAALTILAWMWTTESPFWLLNKGRFSQVETMLTCWARDYRRSLPEGCIRRLAPETDKQPKPSVQASAANQSDRLLSLLSPGLRLTSLSMLCTWFSICLMYYGLSFKMDGLGDNKYLSFFLMSLVEFPSLLVVLWALKRIGRKTCIFWCLVLTTIFSAISMVLAAYSGSHHDGASSKQTAEHLQLAVSVCGKFTSSAVFSILYTYTPELLPTGIRTSGLSVCAIVSRIGAIISPVIISLGHTHFALPYAVFTLGGALSCVAMYRMPETWNKDLPESIEDLQHLVNG